VLEVGGDLSSDASELFVFLPACTLFSMPFLTASLFFDDEETRADRYLFEEARLLF